MQCQPARKTSPDIKLVLQITVDGLRADLLKRYRKSYGKDGFNYLLDNGSVFTNAHYQHANTETIVGHTTLATGTFPSQHGMVGNVIYDRKAGELSYNIEDAEAQLLPSRKQSSTGDQVDPSQKMSRTKGRSPRAIQVPTFSDGLAAYNAGRSKIFGVSGKDRSAVAMAGHSGKAFWYSTDNGDFITSRYYYDDYPAWVRDWNHQRKAEQYSGKQWKLSSDRSSYLLADQDDRPYEVDLKGYGRTFPHQYGNADDKLLYTQLIVSPVGDQLLLDFSKALITNEKLGQGTVPDYLSISFSSVDAANHFFGPSSLENEAVVRELDITLAGLLTFVDKHVGLEHTLIVFSADHGMADMPEYMTELGYSAGRLDSKDILEAANEAGKQMGIDEVVRYFFRPFVYLNKEIITLANLDYNLVEKTIADAITDIEGVNLAVSTKNFSRYKGKRLDDDRLPAKERIWGISLNGEQVAYARSFLEKNTLDNTTIAGKPVLVAWFPEYETLGVFDRTVDGRAIDVSEVDVHGNTPEGKLERLPQYPHVFWMVWSHWFPQTKVMN